MSVHLRKDGRWAVAWREEGRQVWRYFGRGEAAEARARDYDYKVTLERRGPADLPNLKELAHLYLKANQLHRDTVINIVAFINQAPFADQPATLLGAADLQALRQALGGRSNATRNRAQAYIHRILQWSVGQGLIPSNPWAGLARLKETRRIPTATLEDFARIMAALGPRSEYLAWAMKVIFATANRPGQVEVFGVRWEVFHLERGIARIRQGKSGAVKTSILPDWFIEEGLERRARDLAEGIPWVIHRRGHRVVDYRSAFRLAQARAGWQTRTLGSTICAT